MAYTLKYYKLVFSIQQTYINNHDTIMSSKINKINDIN